MLQYHPLITRSKASLDSSRDFHGVVEVVLQLDFVYCSKFLVKDVKSFREIFFHLNQTREIFFHLNQTRLGPHAQHNVVHVPRRCWSYHRTVGELFQVLRFNCGPLAFRRRPPKAVALTVLAICSRPIHLFSAGIT